MIGRLRRRRWGCIILACAMLVTAAAPQRGAAAEETTLLKQLNEERGALKSFDVYHVPDMSLYRTRLTLQRLTESPDRAADFLHISNAKIVAELRSALEQTAIPTDRVCHDAGDHLDVRWAVAMNFQFRRELIGFTRMHECVELGTGDVLAVRRPFFDFMERRFGFLIDR
jgi:hypothetical protein